MDAPALATEGLGDSRGLARDARLTAIEMLHQSGGGHFGGVLSAIDLIAVLYTAAPIGCDRQSGDRFILSKGHAAAGLYAVLAHLGRISADPREYGVLGSGLEGHPDMTTCDAVHFSTGSLGQGLAVGVGMAVALRNTDRHVWVVLGDGECQEGEVWEAAMLASRYRLSTLHVIVDMNGAQECGWVHDPRLDSTPLPQAEQKWSAFGWREESVDGHDHDALASWIRSVRGMPTAPTVALARTRKGHGVSLFERQPGRAHFTQLTSVEYAQARQELSSR